MAADPRTNLELPGKGIYKSLEAARFRLRFKDYFHMKHLYMMMYEWMVEEGFGHGDIYKKRENEDFNETFYLTRETQHAGKEIWIWWRLKKDPGFSKFLQYQVDIDIHCVLLKDTEVVVNGQKFPTNWGDVEVFMNANLVMDPNEEWEKHAWLYHIMNYYRGRMIKPVIEKHKIYLHRDMYRFQEAIKSYFGLKGMLPEKEDQAELTWPHRGIGEPGPST